jgi:hypothetical protein
MTQREMYNTIKNIITGISTEDFEALAPEFSREEIVEGIDARIEALNKKSTGSKKPTKTQIENEGIYANILAFMADGAARTNKAITDTYNLLYNTEYSTNKIQAQVTKAVKGGALNRAVVKGVVYFTINATPTATDDSAEDIVDDVEE